MSTRRLFEGFRVLVRFSQFFSISLTAPLGYRDVSLRVGENFLYALNQGRGRSLLLCGASLAFPEIVNGGLALPELNLRHFCLQRSTLAAGGPAGRFKRDYASLLPCVAPWLLFLPLFAVA